MYELDLGLNHVARKWSEPVDNGANLLIPVLGGGDGPGGVLICAENFIVRGLAPDFGGQGSESESSNPPYMLCSCLCRGVWSAWGVLRMHALPCDC